MLARFLTSRAMTESGVGDPPSSLPLTDSSKVSPLHRSSSRRTLPPHSASKRIVLTLPLARCSPRCVPPMANGTQSRSSPNPYRWSNATMRSMTRRCLRSSGPCRSGATSSKGPNTSSRSGQIIRTWSTLCWRNSSTGDKPGGHFTSLGSTSSFITSLASPWVNWMHFPGAQIMVPVRATTLISPSLLPSSLQSVPSKVLKSPERKLTSSKMFAQAAETHRKNRSLKLSRSSRSPQPVRFIHKSGLSKRDFCTSVAASTSRQLQTSASG